MTKHERRTRRGTRPRPTPSRRRTLAALGSVTLALVAGCSGPQNRQVSGSGDPATLSSATLDETGLIERRASDATLDTRVEATLSGDVSVDAVVEVTVTTPVREYRADGVVVGLVSTPAVRPVEGRGEFRDPLATLSVDEQVSHAQSRYEVSGFGPGREAGTVTLLGTKAPLTRFEATAGRTDVTVSLTRAKDGDDVVTVVVVVPAGSAVDVEQVASGVEH